MKRTRSNIQSDSESSDDDDVRILNQELAIMDAEVVQQQTIAIKAIQLLVHDCICALYNPEKSSEQPTSIVAGNMP